MHIFCLFIFDAYHPFCKNENVTRASNQSFWWRKTLLNEFWHRDWLLHMHTHSRLMMLNLESMWSSHAMFGSFFWAIKYLAVNRYDVAKIFQIICISILFFRVSTILLWKMTAACGDEAKANPKCVNILNFYFFLSTYNIQ